MVSAKRDGSKRKESVRKIQITENHEKADQSGDECGLKHLLFNKIYQMKKWLINLLLISNCFCQFSQADNYPRNTSIDVLHYIQIGGYVTEADWDRIRLSEGFATCFTQTFMEFRYGADRRKQGMDRAGKAIIRFPKAKPDSSVIGPTPSKLSQLLNGNSYQKGAWRRKLMRNPG